MTPEQTESAYQRVCKQECEGCADELPFAVEDRSAHLQLTGDMWPNAVLRHPCTAPSKDALIERHAAQIAAMQAALAQGGHSSMCNSWDKLPCNCYLAALSDDVERGKELLGAVEAKEKAERELGISECNLKCATGTLENIASVLSCGVLGIPEQIEFLIGQRDEARATSQLQAAEIEELRNGNEAAYMRGFADGTTGAVNAIDAAMKEKP